MSEAIKYVDGEYDEAGSDRVRILNALGLELSKCRSEAIAGREGSGIEDEWLEDEEMYEGIDDINRGEMKAWWRQKPMGQAGPGTKHDGSTIFINITRPYCDAAAARVGDMLLPTDDRGWSIKPTPVPELIDIASGKIPPHIEQQIDDAFPDAPEVAQKTKDELIEQEKKTLDIAKAAATKAESRIEDWHVESQYHAEVRKVIESAARIGTGVLKGPIPTRKVRVAFKGGALIIEETIAPASVSVDPWNCYPDPACGERVADGRYHWERDEISPKRLQELIFTPGYIAEEIRECLREGPAKAGREFQSGERRPGLIDQDRTAMFEIWYYHGTLSREQVEAAGCECEESSDGMVPCIVTMVNNRVIKATLSVLDVGDIPYDYFVWQRRSGLPWGIGISRQIRTPQRIVNGAGRNMMDNAGLSGGPMWIFKQGVVTPLDGQYQLGPRKGWAVDADAEIEDVREAFTFIEIPMAQESLQAIIEMGLKLAEDVTGLPMLLQGQQGEAPDTVGGMTMLHNNASSVMRRIARLFDDLITEPHIRRYYAYLLQHGENDDEKGEFVVDARGSSTLVERDINTQGILAMAQMVPNPVFGIDPKRWMEEWLKSQHLDPNRFSFEDEEWRQVVEQLAASAQQGDSSVEVAQIRAQTELQKLQGVLADKDADRQLKVALAAMEEQYDEQERQMQMALEAVQQDLEGAKLASDRETALDKIKAALAEVVMKLRQDREELRAQITLASMKQSETKPAPQVTTPPSEPAGRAPQGQAFQR
jgi:hypothetical protein